MPSLTRDEAVARAELLRVHDYRIELDLSSAADAGGDRPGTFASTTRIRFSARHPAASTFVEMKCADLHEVTLNGTAITPANLAGNRLHLDGLGEENELVVRASMAYSNTGEGLHRFIDPEDGAVYLYAQSFLDDAQRIFACFDQPDLKAEFTLTVSAPTEWEVAANGVGTQVAPGRWEFATTRPLATYLVSLIAGPYHVRRDEHDGIPLALYCRRGLAAHLDKDADEIFGLTKAFFDRYHELFGVRYPFGKYDQAFVPEFNEGAMENAGLVTIRDEVIFRSAVADDERELRAEYMAHEMAHMWFGDLVTMRWWDDLWLNESFAEYMGCRLTSEATRFTDAWTTFAVGRKGWGYAADERPSTHPVAPDSLPDAGLALLNFDGISYAKGAAVVRQLVAWLGEDVFISGLRDHFATHAFGNATLDDLLGALSRSSGRDLSGWAEVWLRRAQVNTFRPEVSIAPDGRFTAMEIVQSAPAEYPTLRPHRIGVGVYEGGSLRRRVEVDLNPSVDGGRTSIAELVGEAAGDLLLVNDGDLTYAKIRFDGTSRAGLTRVLPTLTDPLSRALVWAAVVDAVRDAEEPATEFVELCAAGIPVETTPSVLEDVVRYATSRLADARFSHRGLVDRFLPLESQPAARAAITRALLVAMDSAPPGGGIQLIAARGFISAAGPEDITTLRGWLDGSATPTGLQMDAEMRWTVVGRLAVLGEADDDEIEAEYQRDRSAKGAEHAARSRAARPDAAAKAAAWQIIMSDDSLSNRLVGAAAEGFWQPQQIDLTRPFVQRYFDEMPAAAARRSQAMTLIVSEAAFPRHAVEPATIEAAQRMLNRPDLTPSLRRVVIDFTDELRRALAGRTLVRSSAGRGDH